MTWTFEGKLIEGPIASQYPDLHQKCVEDPDDDDPIWEQFGKATHRHADLLEALRTVTNQTAAAVLGNQEHCEAFGDLAYAVYCLGTNIDANLNELEGDPDEKKDADAKELENVRTMGRTCEQFVELVLRRYGNKERDDSLRDITVMVDDGGDCQWVVETLTCLTKLSLQVVALFGRLKEHERVINELATQCASGLERLAATILAATSRA